MSLTMLVVAAVAAYLIGSIPTGYLATRALRGDDIRTFGSGGTGATNVQRVLGWKWGLGIAVADIAKGAIAVLLARAMDDDPAIAALAGASAVVGHCWPVWLRFRGGKGVATGAGAALALSWWGLLLVPIMVVPVILTRYVSLGSVLAAASAPLLFVALAWADATPRWYIAFGAIAAAVILYKHRDNIRRLATGTERKLGQARRGIEPA